MKLEHVYFQEKPTQYRDMSKILAFSPKINKCHLLGALYFQAISMSRVVVSRGHIMTGKVVGIASKLFISSTKTYEN